MIDVSTQLDPAQSAKLLAVMKEFAREAPLQNKAVVIIAATATMNSAPKFTPISGKLRPVYELSEPERARWKSRPKYAINVMNQKSGYSQVPVFGTRATALAHPARKIKQRGLAQNSWRVLAGKIASGFSLSDSTANKATAVKRNETPLALELTAENFLQYIANLDRQHGIIGKALDTGARAMERELQLRNEAWVQRKWARLT